MGHYFDDPLVKFNSFVYMAVVFSPLISTFSGSLMTLYFNWEAVYKILEIFGLFVLMLIVFKFQESLPSEQRKPDPVAKSYSLY